MSVILCLQCGTLSESTTFCNECGTKLSDDPGAEAPVAAPPSPSPAPAAHAALHPEITTCPEAQGGCGAARQGLGPFCKLCGFNFQLLQPSASPLEPQRATRRTPSTPAEPPTAALSRSVTVQAARPVTLKAVVACDRQLYESLHPQDRRELTFPSHVPAMEFLITGAEVHLGRAVQQGMPHPQIVVRTDPGVSRQHAKFLLQANGTYAILDSASAGGTFLNGNPIQGKLTPIKPGDVLVVGAWTRIDILAQ